MKKNQKLILLLILIISMVKCQKGDIVDKIALIDEIVDVPISTDYDIKNLVSFDSKIWFYLPNYSDSLIFVRYNLYQKKFDSVICNMKETNINFSLNNPNIMSFSINNKYCVLLFFEGFVIFNILNNNFLSYKYSDTLVNKYEYVKILNNKILFGRCYNYFREDKSFNKVELALYDIETQKFLKKINPYFKAIEYSHIQPNHWIDANERFIAFSQTIDFKITIYDSNLNKLFEMKRQPKNWKNIEESLYKTFSNENPKYPKNIIRLLEEIEKLDGSRIEAVQFINDSLLMVCFRPWKKELKNKHGFCYDLFYIKKDGYILKKKDILEFNPDENETCSSLNYPFFSVYYIPCFIKNYAINVSIGAKAYLEYQIGKSYKIINEERNKYIRNNGLSYIMKIYKLNLD